MTLSPLDDYPVHQTAKPIRQVATTDQNFYDRYYFNCHSLDDELCLITGFGCYPNLGTVDAFVVVVHEGLHHVVRASRELGVDRLDTSVGPFQIDVLEGLKRLRVVLAPNEWDVDFDLTFDGAITAQEEPRHLWQQQHRTVIDTTRLAQTGRWAGTLNVAGKRFTVEPDRWWGCRDRSWGVRPIGEPRAPGITAAHPPSMFWTYAQMQFDEFSIVYLVQEDRDGTRVVDGASRVWNDAEREVEHLGNLQHDLVFTPGTRQVERATISLEDVAGRPMTITVEPGLAVYLAIGTGYGRETDWRHGMYQGPLKVEGLTADPSDPGMADRRVGVVDTVATYQLDGHVGHGLWEYSVSGPHDRYGFETWTDGWRDPTG